MADFPSSIFEPRELDNLEGIDYVPEDTKTIFAEDVNKPNAEIVAIEETLGTNPQGAYDTVKDWLTAVATSLASLFSSSTIDPGHLHSKLVAPDGSPNPAVSVNNAGDVDIAALITAIRGGNVGIGNTSPTNLLSVGLDLGNQYPKAIVLGDGGARCAFVAGQSATRLFVFEWFYNATAGNAYCSLSTYSFNNDIRIDGKNVILQAHGGKVGIGTTTPGSALSIVGLPTSASGLSAGDLWVDTTGGLNILKVV